MSLDDRVLTNLKRVQDRIAEAATQAGRDPESIRLVAVTKYVDASIARILAENGQLDLGESRPQQLWEKAEALTDLPIRWHQIGHLQRNKVSRTLPLIELLQSCDSERLLREVQRCSEQQQKRMPLLIEVNISGDASKHGFAPGQVAHAVGQALEHEWTEPLGLMAIASREGGVEQAEQDFQALGELRTDIQQQLGIPLPTLSMGMSGDFEAAIRQGATMVRVGSVLYE